MRIRSLVAAFTGLKQHLNPEREIHLTWRAFSAGTHPAPTNSLECENLLVPVALSCTHVAYSSIRVEPAWMILGQSTGVDAALAAKQNVAVQDLAYPILRERMLTQNQVLDIPLLPPVPAHL